jgi:diacylglycerol kinase (ATP)
LNLPSDFNEALQNIIEGSVVLLDVLCINEKKYCLHLSDIGLDARIVRNFEKEGKRGMRGYMKQMLREAVFKRKKHRSIHIDGEVVPGIDEMKIRILPSVLKVVV